MRRREGEGGVGSRPIQWLSLYLEELSSEIISAGLVGRQRTTVSLPAETQRSDWSMGRRQHSDWLIRGKSATEAAGDLSQLSAPSI